MFRKNPLTPKANETFHVEVICLISCSFIDDKYSTRTCFKKQSLRLPVSLVKNVR